MAALPKFYVAASGTDLTWGSATISAGTTIVVNNDWADSVLGAVRQSAKPQSALDWLDQRVEEMRVKL